MMVMIYLEIKVMLDGTCWFGPREKYYWLVAAERKVLPAGG
jgi:hypothetical protein